MRAVAIVLVVIWHFAHLSILPFGTVHPVILGFLTEGHNGVALFMVLSGYLYGKILIGRTLDLGRFIVSRLLRLMPLLALVSVLTVVINGMDASVTTYILSFLSGFVLPSWPNGGWSIAIEFQFYVLLPLLLALHRRNVFYLPVLVLALVAFRAGYWVVFGEVQFVAHKTLVGRLDQFLAGIVAATLPFRPRLDRRLMLICVPVFVGMYALLNGMGGFRNTERSALWIIFPTIDAVCFAIFIRYYDGRPEPIGKPHRVLPKFIATAGACSYSMYLLHPFFMDPAGRWMASVAGESSNIFVATILSLIVFLVLFPVCWLSYRLIERPPLMLRPQYDRDTQITANDRLGLH